MMGVNLFPARYSLKCLIPHTTARHSFSMIGYLALLGSTLLCHLPLYLFLSWGGQTVVLISQRRPGCGLYSSPLFPGRISLASWWLDMEFSKGHWVFQTFSRLYLLRVITSPPIWWPRNSIISAPSNHFVGRAVILALPSLPNNSFNVLRCSTRLSF